MYEYALTALIYGVAAFVQGVTGFGSALIAMPLITLYLDLPTAVSMSVLLGLVLNTQMAWNYRTQVSRRRIAPMVVGLVPGVVFGVTMLHGVSEYELKMFMAVFLALYALYGLFFEKTKPTGLSTVWGYPAGFAAGAIGAAFSTGGPPVVIYTALSGWGKDTIKANLACFFVLTCLFIVVGHAVTGILTLRVLTLAAVTAPAVYACTRLGIMASAHLKEHSYRKLLFVMLLLMGIMMWRSA